MKFSFGILVSSSEVVVWTFFRSDASHSTNSYWLCEDLGKDAMVDSAAERFRPQMMMWALRVLSLLRSRL
jgi:hypothetical protein